MKKGEMNKLKISLTGFIAIFVVVAMCVFFAFGSRLYVVNLDAPTNATWTNLTNITLNCSYGVTEYDDGTMGNVSNITLYHNFNGTWAYNMSNTSWINATGNTTWNFTINLTDAAEGTYQWACYVGNQTGEVLWSAANNTIYADRTAPHTITLNAPSLGLNTTSTSLYFNWTAVDSFTNNMSCALIIDGTVNESGMNTLNDTLQNATQVTQLANGTHEWNVTCSDNAGNGNFSVLYRVTVDTAVPSDITLNGPANGLNTTNTTLNFNWTALDNTASSMNCTLVIDGTYNASNLDSANDTMTNLTVSGFAEGMHQWNVTCMDDAGNVNTSASETRNVFVDTTAPEDITLNAPVLGGNFTNNTFYFNWTVTDSTNNNFSCKVTVDGVVNVTDINTLNGTMKNSTFTTDFANGTHEWNVTCIDDAGNENTSATYRFVVDTVAPTNIALNYPTNLSNVTTTINFNFTASDNLQSELVCNITIDGVVNVSNLNVSADTMNQTTVTGFANGTHEWNVSCKDLLGGNTGLSNTSATYTFYVDTTDPTVSLNFPPSSNWSYSGDAIMFNFTATDTAWDGGANVVLSACSLYGNFNGSFNSWEVNQTLTHLKNDTTYNFSAANLGEGNFTWNVWCNDSAGNSAYATLNYSKYVDLTNATASVSFSSSTPSPYTEITITCSASDNLDTNPSAEIISIIRPDGSASGDIDGTFSDTAQVGTYTVRCKATDASTRIGFTTGTFTTTVDDNSAAGGGGSGGAAAPTPSMTTTLGDITPDEPAIIEVTNEDIGVSEIELAVESEVTSGVKVEVKKINAPPAGTPSVSKGKVYRYLEIKKENLEDEDMKEAKISFFVDKSWLDENKIQAGNVVLKKYDEAWYDLPTKLRKIGADKQTYYYEATTPSFSVFAVGVKEGVAAEEVAEEEEEEEEVVEEEVVEEEEEAIAEEKKSSTVWIAVIVIVALILIGALVYFLVLKKKP